MSYPSRLRSILSLAASLMLLGPLAETAAAQATATVRGTVREAGSMRPISGAQVSVAGTQRRVVTDAEGEYTLVVPSGQVQVRAERVGYMAAARTITVAAGQTEETNFTLATAAISLDAVVVTGTPGAQTQAREVGNAVSQINAAEITQRAPATTVTQLLQGRAPGLTVMAPSGSVGTASSIRIRGTGSVSAGNFPVVVIDGVRMAAGGQSRFGVGGQTSSFLDAINPEDIESIEVIKGPAASTLYGADAAAGVIQIITKKGRTGRQSLEWTAKVDQGRMDWGAAEMLTNYTLCDANKQRARYLRPGGTAGNAADSLPLWTGCQDVPVNSVITDQPLRRQGLREGSLQNYTLGVRGGGERYSFFVSGDREEASGVFTNNTLARTTGRANFFVAPSDQLNFTGTVQMSASNSRLPLNDNASNGWLRNAYRGLPGQFREGSSYALGWRGLGPAEMTIFDNRLDSERFILGLSADYQPFEWFRNRLTAGVDAANNRNIEYYPIDVTGRQPYGPTAALGAVYIFQPSNRVWTLDYSGTVSNRFSADLESDLSFGMQANLNHVRSLTAWCEGLISNQLRDCDQTNTRQVFEGYSEQNSVGYFVQEQVGWRDRVFLTGAVRVDDNSAFGDEFSLVVYPKAQASWVVSEEPFFRVGAFDNLRLRAAWGQAGNSPSPFSADRTFLGATALMFDNTGNEATASAIRSGVYGNPNLKAETGEELEAGFDASLFNGRMGAAFTYYNKRTYDALIPVPIMPSTGFANTILANVGTISNRGVELSLNGTVVQTENVGLESQLVFSTNRNRFLSFRGARTEPIPQGYGGSQYVKEGFPIAGYFARMPVRNEDGSYKFASGSVVLEDTVTYVGPSVPTREAGFSNTLTLWRNLRLYGFADYKGGHYLYNMTEQTRNSDLNTRVTNDPALAQPGADSTQFRFLRTPGNNLPYIQRADFIKLRELSASYTLPSRFTGRFGSEAATFTLTGRNLAILWKRYPGPDPEVNIEGNDQFTRGDYMSVPMIREFRATLSLTF